MKRRVCVVTGSRSEYGLLKPVMRALRARRDVSLQVVTGGMHLSSEFGRTERLLKADGFKAAASVRMHPAKDDAKSMALAMGEGIKGMTKALDRLKPDVVVVLGDRTEALAAAVAAAYLGLPVAHLHGGDKTRGGLDESARHAITKLAHIHFPATAASKARVLKLGERADRVFQVGAPGLDSILGETLLSRDELSKALGFTLPERFAVLLQHSVTTQISKAGAQIRETLAALAATGLPVVAVYPNSDAGGRAIIKELKAAERRGALRAFKSLPHRVYLSLLAHAALLVGNSSSGVIESSSFKLPVVNVGTRQESRERSTNVLDVPHERRAILRAIRKALHDRAFRARVKRCVNPYGDGRTGERVARTLATLSLNHGLIQKQLTY